MLTVVLMRQRIRLTPRLHQDEYQGSCQVRCSSYSKKMLMQSMPRRKTSPPTAHLRAKPALSQISPFNRERSNDPEVLGCLCI